MPEHIRSDKSLYSDDYLDKFKEVKKYYTWHYNFVNINLFKHYVKPLGVITENTENVNTIDSQKRMFKDTYAYNEMFNEGNLNDSY